MSIRSFFAVDIKEKSIVDQIKQIQNELALPDTRINFVAPKNLHLTLKFLGNIDENILTDLEKEANKISFSNFDIEFVGMGCLPSFSYINAIYVGISKGFEQLASIAKQLNSLSSQFNFKKETRPYRAHLTIGRLKRVGDKNKLIEKIKSYKEHNFGNVSINEFILKKSDLRPDGPVYSALFQVKGKE
jgi:2'-5' RNA ligase